MMMKGEVGGGKEREDDDRGEGRTGEELQRLFSPTRSFWAPDRPTPGSPEPGQVFTKAIPVIRQHPENSWWLLLVCPYQGLHFIHTLFTRSDHSQKYTIDLNGQH